MKIYIDTIPDEGLEIRDEIDPHKILLDYEGINFFEPIGVIADVKKAKKELFIDVAIEAPVEYTCARCLAKFQGSFKKKFDLSYEVKHGDVLELDEDIRQEMILDYPMKVVCNPGCKGLCPNCGQNLNIGKCECK